GPGKGRWGAGSGQAGDGEAVRDGEECRLCLRQAYRRKCCSEFYCSDCYFKAGVCPSCGKAVERRAQFQRVPRDPGLWPVAAGYAVSLLVVVSALAVVAVAIANDRTLPATVIGHRCYGFFTECSSEDACVAFPDSLAEGLLPPAHEWEACTLETVNKMYGSYCVYDKQV
ncbi:unnamed protein product, partial [Phaeothamnion confervicola]